MFRKSLKDQIERVKDEVLLLGSMTEQVIDVAVHCFVTQCVSHVKAQKEIKKINQRYQDLKVQIIGLIATQQPTARDLRVLVASLEISGELKHMGDYAVEILKTEKPSHDQDQEILLRELQHMVKEVSDMLYHSMTAFLNEDIHAVYPIAAYDSVIDALYQQLYFELLDYATKGLKYHENLNSILYVAHNLERFADRVTNICERIIFISLGQITELGSKDDLMDPDFSPVEQSFWIGHLPKDEDKTTRQTLQ